MTKRGSGRLMGAHRGAGITQKGSGVTRRGSERLDDLPSRRNAPLGESLEALVGVVDEDPVLVGRSLLLLHRRGP